MMLRQLMLIKTNKTIHIIKSLNSFYKPFFSLAKICMYVTITSLIVWCLTEIIHNKVELIACPVVNV